MDEETLRQYLGGTIDENAVRAPPMAAPVPATLPASGSGLRPGLVAQFSQPAQPPEPRKQLVKVRFHYGSNDSRYFTVNIDAAATVQQLVTEAQRRAGSVMPSTPIKLPDGSELHGGDQVQSVIRPGQEVTVGEHRYYYDS